MHTVLSNNMYLVKHMGKPKLSKISTSMTLTRVPSSWSAEQTQGVILKSRLLMGSQ